MTLQSPATSNKNEKCYVTNYQNFTTVIRHYAEWHTTAFTSLLNNYLLFSLLIILYSSAVDSAITAVYQHHLQTVLPRETNNQQAQKE